MAQLIRYHLQIAFGLWIPLCVCACVAVAVADIIVYASRTRRGQPEAALITQMLKPSDLRSLSC